MKRLCCGVLYVFCCVLIAQVAYAYKLTPPSFDEMEIPIDKFESALELGCSSRVVSVF